MWVCVAWGLYKMLSQCLSESGKGRGTSLQKTINSSLWKLLLEQRTHVNNHSPIGQASFLFQSCPFLVCLLSAGVLSVRTRVYTALITTRTVYSSVQIIAVIPVLMIPIKLDYLSIKPKKQNKTKHGITHAKTQDSMDICA